MATILLEVYHTSTHDVALLSANLECMSEMCCTRLAENTGHKNTQNLFNGNISSICLHNMLNFGPLMAEICWRVWGIPANFKGFRVLASLLHCTDVAQWRSTKLCTMFGRLLRWYTIYIFWGLLLLTEFCQLQNSLSVQVLRSPIGSVTARHSSSGRQPKFAAWYKEWNYGTFAEGATCLRQGGHHVGHRPTF